MFVVVFVMVGMGTGGQLQLEVVALVEVLVKQLQALEILDRLHSVGMYVGRPVVAVVVAVVYVAQKVAPP